MNTCRGLIDLLSRPSVLAVIIELKGHGNWYGLDEERVVDQLLALGFWACTYDLLTRPLIPAVAADNLVFVRDVRAVVERVEGAEGLSFKPHQVFLPLLLSPSPAPPQCLRPAAHVQHNDRVSKNQSRSY